jgi:hypothetical protein
MSLIKQMALKILRMELIKVPVTRQILLIHLRTRPMALSLQIQEFRQVIKIKHRLLEFRVETTKMAHIGRTIRTII